MPTTTPLTLALVALFVPAGAALLIGVVAPLRRAGKPAAYLAVAAALASLFAALSLFQNQLVHPHAVVLETTHWLPGVGRAVADVGIRLDGISIPMLVVVTGVASMVQIFSLGYMAEEPMPAFGRYFGYHSLFIFSMNLLVLAPNLLQLFAGWELVGLTSYLLIGFYWSKPSAARAAVKAFWVTKFADMGLVLGVITLYRMTGGFDWNASLSIPAATLVSLLLFVAVMGKSAQFPLHVWLPDAMEGPTPVSALLHAATMVAAGVYLIVRANPIFAAAPGTQMVMVWIGSFTALFAAVVAVVQTDIKKVLAYSTCSQLGYMIAALGAGSLMAGYFHLTTHAFFKALLFLGAGSVIHAVHSNELSSMGGLAKKMKLTTITFVVGALALAGFPGFSGFFSKDLILEALYEKALWGPLALLLLAAFLTAFYMGRVVFLTFFGKPSEAAEHAHESGVSMGLPLSILGVLALGAGLFGGRFAEMYGVEYEFHLGTVGMTASGLGIAGILLSWLIYGNRSVREQAFGFLSPLGKLARGSLIDDAYLVLFRRGFLGVAGIVGWFDRYIIDGFMNFLAWGTIEGGKRVRKMQTGNVQDYVYAVIAGAVALTAWGLFR